MSSLVFLTPRSRTQRQRLALINVINSIRKRNASVTERFVIERYRCDRIRKLDRLGRTSRDRKFAIPRWIDCDGDRDGVNFRSILAQFSRSRAMNTREEGRLRLLVLVKIVT